MRIIGNCIPAPLLSIQNCIFSPHSPTKKLTIFKSCLVGKPLNKLDNLIAVKVLNFKGYSALIIAKRKLLARGL